MVAAVKLVFFFSFMLSCYSQCAPGCGVQINDPPIEELACSQDDGLKEVDAQLDAK